MESHCLLADKLRIRPLLVNWITEIVSLVSSRDSDILDDTPHFFCKLFCDTGILGTGGIFLLRNGKGWGRGLR